MYVNGMGSTSLERKGSQILAHGARDAHPPYRAWVFLVACSRARTSSWNMVCEGLLLRKKVVIVINDSS